MPISVKCKCGKGFKVKDHLAGKAIKCPGCGGPLRIPAAAAPVGVGNSAPPSSGGKPGVEDALLRFEEVQRKKQMSAEEEAAFQAEKNKLIASYDQLTGHGTTKEKKKKSELAESGVKKKPTIFSKIADAFGAMAGTLVFKYVIVTVLLAGGVVGSVYLVKYVTGYMSKESSAPQKPRDEHVRDLMKEAEDLIAAKKFSEARSRLNEIIRLDRNKDVNRDYQAMVKAVEEGLAAQKP